MMWQWTKLTLSLASRTSVSRKAENYSLPLSRAGRPGVSASRMCVLGAGDLARSTCSPLWSGRFHSAGIQATSKSGVGLPIQKLSWIPGTGVREGVYYYFMGVWVGGLDFGRQLREKQNNPE